MNEQSRSAGGRPADPSPGRDDAAIVRLQGITKTFPAVKALNDVNFDVRPGEVHALCGENGAGKSTLLKILFGVLQPDEGTLEVEGAPAGIASPRDALDAGVAMIAQELSLVPAFTVAQNIMLGQEPRKGPRIDWKRLYAQARETLDDLGLDISADARVDRLSVANRQLVEIARAIRRAARVIVMDEPTSSLPANESELLLSVISRLRDADVGVAFVTHRLEEVERVADRVTVLRDGNVVAVVDGDDINEQTIVRHMVGRDLFEGVEHERPDPSAAVLLEVDELGREGVVEPTSFTLHRGEIVGIAGLVGAGRTELVRLIFGADHPDSGSVTVDGQRLAPGQPQAAIRAGVGFVTEDRKGQGLVPQRSVADNIALPILQRLRRGRVLVNHRRKHALAHDIAKDLQLRPLRTDVPVNTLSGGNQQKVVIGRWLANECKVFIFDEPTRGIDVGAKGEIHRLMAQLVSDGAGIVMVSSELDEVLKLADRVLVMRDGRVILDAPRGELTEERVGEAMIGTSSAAA